LVAIRPVVCKEKEWNVKSLRTTTNENWGQYQTLNFGVFYFKNGLKCILNKAKTYLKGQVPDLCVLYKHVMVS
jgi:hypothetical protein